jgi:capsular polysaccharide biosynthesis protein
MPGWFGQKTRILIFGTGAGGTSFYKRCRGRYNIIGFLDNNPQKHGQRLFNKTIYAPHSLPQLAYDKIIIVSDYYREIHQQLIQEFAISEQKISVFQADSALHTPLLQRCRKHLELAAHDLMCRRPGLLSDFLYWSLLRRQQSNSIRRLPLRWLDQADANRVHMFRTAEDTSVQGPRWIGQEVPAQAIELPAVALYHFRHGQVCSVSRSILFPDLQAGPHIVAERVTTSTLAHADYSGAHLVHHGQALALVRLGQAERIACGILISGCNEVNYYHWVLEILPQLQFLDELPECYAGYPVLIPAFSQKIPSIKALLDSIGIKRAIIYLSNITSYLVADLLLISAPNNFIPNRKGSAARLAEDSYARPESIAFLRDKARALTACVDRQALPKRVFLARKGVLRQYNQAEVVTLLESYGFVCVYMEDQDIAHQVAIMANAECIIGPTGAAWTNILFASAGTRALCWMAEEWGQLSCFSNLAAIVGVSMDYLPYRANTSDSRELYYKEYRIDIDMIHHWLQQHLAPVSDGYSRPQARIADEIANHREST